MQEKYHTNEEDATKREQLELISTNLNTRKVGGYVVCRKRRVARQEKYQKNSKLMNSNTAVRLDQFS
jgi:hypothetical protein